MKHDHDVPLTRADKIIIGIMLTALAIMLALTSCAHDPEIPKPPLEHPVTNLGRGDGYYVGFFEFDGCKFLLSYRGGMLHMPTCANPKHNCK